MTEAVLVVFTACWIAQAIPLSTKAECEDFKGRLVDTLATAESGIRFSAECHPGGTDLEALERERWQTFACFQLPIRDPRRDRRHPEGGG